MCVCKCEHVWVIVCPGKQNPKRSLGQAVFGFLGAAKCQRKMCAAFFSKAAATHCCVCECVRASN